MSDFTTKESITINGGTVYATAKSVAAAIGSGYMYQKSPDITITGGNITAKTGSGGAGIGSGALVKDNSNTISISGGYIYITGTKYYIGSALQSVGTPTIIITGGCIGTGDTESGTAYNVSVPDGYVVIANTDATTAATYPYMVVKASYELTPDMASVDFGSSCVGYESISGQELVLTNTGNMALGNLSVSFENSAGADYFTIDTQDTAASLDALGTTSFTVTPNTGLAAGSYAATVNITADELSEPLSIAVSFEVLAHSYSAPTFTWAADG
ncbi:MAG: hypothetical protein LUH82_07275, partial [Clostridiales bacterium]|nr:hypothetical protein [Clostridiales bacterium]